MNTTEKGNALEDALYDYLCAQKEAGQLVFGTYSPECCTIFKKKNYYCIEREGNINFDVVIELCRHGSTVPTLHIVFECKNHQRPIQESDITDASDKIARLFKHNAKGVIVGSSGLQRGAENVARKRGMAIVKYDSQGLDVVAERTDRSWLEPKYLEKQIFGKSKSLKFSGYFDGNYFGTFQSFLAGLGSDPHGTVENASNPKGQRIPYLSDLEMEETVAKLLKSTRYTHGPVNLEKICSELSIELTYSESNHRDQTGSMVLGTANFSEQSIQINRHGDLNRERFTLAHEIGHFYLGHGKFLSSDSVAENDLLIDNSKKDELNYERLEYQANSFASQLLLPRDQLLRIVYQWVLSQGQISKGQNFIYVDDQPCNFMPYNNFMNETSSALGCSKHAISIRLKKLRLLKDERKQPQFSSAFIRKSF